MKYLNLPLALFIFLALAAFMPCPAIQAASLNDDLKAAAEAWKSGEYSKAADLFNAVGKRFAEGGNAQAPQVLGNAALSYLKADAYDKATSLYRNILSTYRQLPLETQRQLHTNLVVCLGLANKRREQLEAIDSMLATFPNLDAKEKAAILFHRGDAYRMLELYRTAVDAYKAALEGAGADSSMRARILTPLALCEGNLGNYEDARRHLNDAQKIAQKDGDPRTLAEISSNLGVLALEQGDYQEAEKLLQNAVEIALANRLAQNEIADTNHLGMLYLNRGLFEEASRDFELALKLAKEAGQLRSQAIAQENMALLQRIQGRHKDARANYAEAAKLFGKAGFQEGLASTLLGTGRMAELADKNYAAALQDYQKALEIFTSLELPRWQAAAASAWGFAQAHSPSRPFHKGFGFYRRDNPAENG